MKGNPETGAGAGGGKRPASPWLNRVLLGATLLFIASTYFSIAVNSLSLGLMAVCWVAVMVAGRRILVKRTPLDYFFLAYIGAEGLATIFSGSPLESLFIARRVLLIGIVYFFSSWVTTMQLARRVMLVLLGAAAVVAVIGIAKLLAVGPGENGRLGIFEFYMTTSELMMIATLLLFAFVVHQRTPAGARAAACAALVPVAVALYATVTRGAYLATAAGVLFIAGVRNRKLVLVLLVLIVALVVFAPPFVASRIASIVDVHHPENASRLLLWTTGLRIFADHPVVGVGDIDLGNLLRHYADPGWVVQWGHVHNMALQFLVTLGIVGIVAVTAMFVRIAMVEWRIYRRVKTEWFQGSVVLGALGVFVGVQVAGLTEWTFGDQEIAVLFWITVGMALAMGNLGETGGARED